MVHEITGDLLKVKQGIICHQTNYYGVMGGGIAAAIADRILTAEQYAAYSNYCKQAGRTALGTVQFLGNVPGLVVANMFCQDESKPQVDGRYDITDYEAMVSCLIRIRDLAEAHKLTVHIPHHIGCGIAGGDWNLVRQLIYSIFSESVVDVFIVAREAANGKA